nr:hypothetical protein [Tanacetum cinerariifolium]
CYAAVKPRLEAVLGGRAAAEVVVVPAAVGQRRWQWGCCCGDKWRWCWLCSGGVGGGEAAEVGAAGGSGVEVMSGGGVVVPVVEVVAAGKWPAAAGCSCWFACRGSDRSGN